MNTFHFPKRRAAAACLCHAPFRPRRDRAPQLPAELLDRVRQHRPEPSRAPQRGQFGSAHKTVFVEQGGVELIRALGEPHRPVPTRPRSWFAVLVAALFGGR